MESKRIDRVWAMSLIAVGIATVILAGEVYLGRGCRILW